MNHIFHDDFLWKDIPRIQQEMGEAEFDEFTKCLDKAFEEIERNLPDGAPLERSLAAYRKKKFHSLRRPPQGMRADYRLVYRCDLERNDLILLGVGKRKPGKPDDVYAIITQRTPI